MSKQVYIGTDKKKFKKVLEQYTDQNMATDRRKKILKKYSTKYKIKKEVVNIKGKRVHMDYLPTIDAMLEANKEYSHAKEVIGGALYKLESDHCIFFTDTQDTNLKRVYKAHQREANIEAKKLWKLNTEEFDCQWTHVHARILSGSFEAVFGQTYGSWRESLSKPKQEF